MGRAQEAWQGPVAGEGGGAGKCENGRTRGGSPLDPPPHPDQSDYRGKQRNLPLGKIWSAIFGTQSSGSQPPSPLSNTSLFWCMC